MAADRIELKLLELFDTMSDDALKAIMLAYEADMNQAENTISFCKRRIRVIADILGSRALQRKNTNWKEPQKKHDDITGPMR